jgi:hypothetical protein
MKTMAEQGPTTLPPFPQDDAPRKGTPPAANASREPPRCCRREDRFRHLEPKKQRPRAA